MVSWFERFLASWILGVWFFCFLDIGFLGFSVYGFLISWLLDLSVSWMLISFLVSWLLVSWFQSLLVSCFKKTLQHFSKTLVPYYHISISCFLLIDLDLISKISKNSLDGSSSFSAPVFPDIVIFCDCPKL